MMKEHMYDSGDYPLRSTREFALSRFLFSDQLSRRQAESVEVLDIYYIFSSSLAHGNEQIAYKIRQNTTHISDSVSI